VEIQKLADFSREIGKKAFDTEREKEKGGTFPQEESLS